DYVNYVWFDALSNYISFAGYDPKIDNYESQPKEFLDRWPALQIIGKDILIPAHGIYWPIMLHALGFPDEQMPRLLVHGWWNIGGAKMSKSVGNVVDPFALIEKYGIEALRYYLMSVDTGQDADFREGSLVSEFNMDLANTFGNLVNRTLNMIHRFRNGRISSIDVTTLAEGTVRSHLQTWSSDELVAGRELYEKKFAQFRPSNAFNAPLARALKCNTLVEISSPWNLAKDKKQEALLDAVLYHLAESLRIIAIMISPVAPKAAHGIFDQLNWKMELGGREERFSLADAEWGRLPDGHVVGKPVPLFPRIEAS
ncbi:MAG TPA: class I tRNA ligase family protein, partial [Chthoniobacterales bacterium]|nr:class I tRNA ligase family protein [Chthoniobacterales bacterium]